MIVSPLNHASGRRAVISVQERTWDKVAAWHLGISTVPSEISMQLFSESIPQLPFWIGQVLSTHLLVIECTIVSYLYSISQWHAEC